MTGKKLQPNGKNICIIILIAVILANLLFSYQFITENAHHTCSEEHCSVCVQLEEAFHFIRSIKHVPSVPFLMAILCLLINWVPFAAQQPCPNRTLVSLKVELLN